MSSCLLLLAVPHPLLWCLTTKHNPLWTWRTHLPVQKRDTGRRGMLGAGLKLVAEQSEPPAQQALTCQSWSCCRQKYGQRCHCVLWAHRHHTGCAVPTGKPKAPGVSRRQESKGSPLSSPHPTLLLGLTSTLTSHTATSHSLCGLLTIYLSNVLDSL